jgi:hypothetical protein
MSAPGDNRLPALAAEIRSAHEGVETAALAAAERALAAGTALIEAKGLVQHGEWLPFLAKTGIHERMAQRYMTLAASGLNSDTVSLLGGIGSALRFLRLRTVAMDNLRAAEAANIAGSPSDAQAPLETFIELVGEMVAMFPPSVYGRREIGA